jgi:hypothetical protein
MLCYAEAVINHDVVFMAETLYCKRLQVMIKRISGCGLRMYLKNK